MSDLKIVYISWSKAIRMCYRLAELILDYDVDFDSIVTISRGGLIPGRIVSDVLNIDTFYTIRARHWSSYGKLFEKPVINVYEQLDVRGKNVLVIDEVVDTGLTMNSVVNLLNNLGAKLVKTGVLHYKLTSIHKPDFYVEEVKEWVWIFYPWSLSETLYGLLVKTGDLSSESIDRLIEKIGVEKNYIDHDHLIKSINRYRVR